MLLIEDDHDDAEMIMYALRKLDHVELIHIDDGENALAYLEQLTTFPSLILLDLKMPKIDGIQILATLKSDAEKKRIPVAALISSNDGKRYLESHGVKPDGYLLKPVDTLAFLMLLTEIGMSNLPVEKISSTVRQSRKP